MVYSVQPLVNTKCNMTERTTSEAKTSQNYRRLFWKASQILVLAAPFSIRVSSQSRKFEFNSLAHKSNFAGHVIITTGLQRMNFPRPGIILR